MFRASRRFHGKIRLASVSRPMGPYTIAAREVLAFISATRYGVRFAGSC